MIKFGIHYVNLHKLQSGKVSVLLFNLLLMTESSFFWQLLWLQEPCGWALWVGNRTGLWWWKPKVSFWGGEGWDLIQNRRLGGPEAKRCVGLLWKQVSWEGHENLERYLRTGQPQDRGCHQTPAISAPMDQNVQVLYHSTLCQFFWLYFCIGLESVWLSGPLPSAGIGTRSNQR